MAIRMPPATMSGPAHGVALAIGHETLTWDGAAASPSVATRTLMSSGSCSGAIRRSSCWNSSSHRSEPIGLRASAASASRFRIRRRGRFRGLACIGHRLVLDGRGDGIRDDLAGSSEGDLVVGRVGEPRLEVGGAAVRGEDLPLALRTQRLGTRELVEDRTVDQQVRCVFLDRDGDGLGLRALEDRALSDARADHHGGQHECRHSPHETHENTSPGPAGECGGPSTRHFRLAKDT